MEAGCIQHSVLYLENVSSGGKTKVPKNKGGKPGIQLFSVIYAILIDIRLDEFPRGGARKMPRPPKCALGT